MLKSTHSIRATLSWSKISIQTTSSHRRGVKKRINTTHAKIQLSKILTQPQAMSYSDISLSNTTWFNFGLDPIRVTTGVPSNIDPAKSRLQAQIQFFTLLSCNLEPNITIPTSQKIDILADIFKLDGSDTVDEYRFLKPTHSTSKNNTSKSKTSRLRKPTQMIKVASCRKLKSRLWQIVTS